MSLLIDALKKAEDKPLTGIASRTTSDWLAIPGNLASSLGLSREMGLVIVAALVFIGSYFIYVYFAMQGPAARLFAAAPQPVEQITTPVAAPEPVKPLQVTQPASQPQSSIPAEAKSTRSSAPSQQADTPAQTGDMLTRQDQVKIVSGNQSPAINPLALQAYNAWQEGKLDQAQTLYTALLQQQPSNVDALLGLAAIASQRKQSDQAVRYYSSVLQLDPHNPTAQAGLINLADAADPSATGTRLRQLVANEPGNAALYYALGNHYSRNGNWQAAEEAYFSAVETAPQHPDYAFNLAISLDHLGQGRQALQYYQQAISLAVQHRYSFDMNQAKARAAALDQP